jgi:hypothetical protein
MYLRDSNDAFSPHYGGRKSFMKQGRKARMSGKGVDYVMIGHICAS